METFSVWLEEALGLDPALQSKLLASLLTVAALLLLRGLIQRLVVHRVEDARLRYNAQKTATYLAFVVGVILVGRIWFEAIHSLFTFLGLLSAGLAIALKDPIVNMFGWVFILWRNPFGVSDRIQIGPHTGDVVDLRVFQFSILEIGNWVHAEQSTGRVIHIPNGKVFTDELANYSQGLSYIWTEIPVLVTFESDWQKAKAILQKVADEYATPPEINLARKKKTPERFVIVQGKQTPTVYTSVEASGVLLTVRCPTDPRRRRDTEQAVWEGILHEFDWCPDIEFAYPTQRFYNRLHEEHEGGSFSHPPKRSTPEMPQS